MRRFALPLVLSWLACLPSASAQFADGGFESVPSLPAAELLPAALGGDLTLDDPVRLDGYRAVFEVRSPRGGFTATGRELLLLRVAEQPAIAALGRINKGEEFAVALARAAQAPVDFVGKLIDAPGPTLGNVALGLEQLIGKAGNAVRGGLEDLADGAATPAPASAPAAAAGENAELPPAVGELLGYNKARRLWARTLGVDPYTSNPVLGRLLDDAASASFAGNFAVDTTLGLVAAPVKFAVGFDSESRDAVWDLSPEDIRQRNERRLLAMGIQGRPARNFLRNRQFTPTLQTALVGALERLTGARGRGGVIEGAATMKEESDIRSLIGTLHLLADHHRHAAPLAALRLDGALAVAADANGGLVAALDADYFYWDAAAVRLLDRPQLAAPRRTLLLSGRASARAAREIRRAGWMLMENRRML